MNEPQPLGICVSERIETDDRLVSGDGVTRYVKNGTVYSVYPPTAHLTFSNWIYMVPPYKPYSVLMLGYAGGTTAGLIQKLWGEDVPITGVDLSLIDNRYNVNLIRADAREFVKACRKFDVVIIDIFDEQQTPAFVASDEFIRDIAGIVENFLVIHASPDLDLRGYQEHFDRLRDMDLGHQIVYFKTKNSTVRFYATQ